MKISMVTNAVLAEFNTSDKPVRGSEPFCEGKNTAHRVFDVKCLSCI